MAIMMVIKTSTVIKHMLFGQQIENSSTYVCTYVYKIIIPFTKFIE